MRARAFRTILAGLVATAPVAPAEAAPPRSLVLFGARWCAPCMGEYAALAPVIEAAAPHPVVLAWTDRPIAPPRSLPSRLAGQVHTMGVDAARQLAQRIGGEGYGLPMAALVDAEGKACAVWKAPLTPADVETMRRRCGG